MTRILMNNKYHSLVSRKLFKLVVYLKCFGKHLFLDSPACSRSKTVAFAFPSPFDAVSKVLKWEKEYKYKNQIFKLIPSASTMQNSSEMPWLLLAPLIVTLKLLAVRSLSQVIPSVLHVRVRMSIQRYYTYMKITHQNMREHVIAYFCFVSGITTTLKQY